MIKKTLFLAFTTCLFLMNCKFESQEKDLFYGKWKGAKWVVKGQDMQGMDPSMINFEFNKKDNTYSASFAGTKETGSFNLNNNCFNAMSIYGSPKKCPILKLTQDTMVWMMDSVQQEGNLYLIRVKE
jgi:Lipocalin-like domain